MFGGGVGDEALGAFEERIISSVFAENQIETPQRYKNA